MKIELNDVPIVVTAARIKTEISEAIMAYSIAVAPPWLATKRLSNDFMAILPEFRDYGSDEFTGTEFWGGPGDFPGAGTSRERVVAFLIRC